MNKSFTEDLLEVGVDECARGVLFGRIYGAAVIYPKNGIDDEMEKMLNDSKKLSAKKRELLYDFIINNVEDYAISWVDEKEIDEKGIQPANYKVFHNSIEKLEKTPDIILVDGNRFEKYKDIKHECIIKGDSKYYSIACASILAKVEHDKYIKKLVEENSEIEKYDLLNNMGYGTKKHIEAIKSYGYSNYHRRSYKIKSLQKN